MRGRLPSQGCLARLEDDGGHVDKDMSQERGGPTYQRLHVGRLSDVVDHAEASRGDLVVEPHRKHPRGVEKIHVVAQAHPLKGSCHAGLGGAVVDAPASQPVEQGRLADVRKSDGHESDGTRPQAHPLAPAVDCRCHLADRSHHALHAVAGLSVRPEHREPLSIEVSAAINRKDVGPSARGSARSETLLPLVGHSAVIDARQLFSDSQSTQLQHINLSHLCHAALSSADIMSTRLRTRSLGFFCAHVSSCGCSVDRMQRASRTSRIMSTIVNCSLSIRSARAMCPGNHCTTLMEAMSVSEALSARLSAIFISSCAGQEIKHMWPICGIVTLIYAIPRKQQTQGPLASTPLMPPEKHAVLEPHTLGPKRLESCLAAESVLAAMPSRLDRSYYTSMLIVSPASWLVYGDVRLAPTNSRIGNLLLAVCFLKSFAFKGFDKTFEGILTKCGMTSSDEAVATRSAN